MTVLSAVRSWTQRRPGDQRRRFLLHHLPLALASAIIFVVFMTLPIFDAGRSTTAMPDILLEGVGAGWPPRTGGPGLVSPDGGNQVPQQQGAAHEMPPGFAGQAPQHGGGQTGPTSQPGPSGSNSLSMRQLTFATGYLALGLLGLTLMIGPANLLLRRRNPVSNYLSRDVGMWAAGGSVLHVIFGLGVHQGGKILDNAFFGYFIGRDGSPLTNSLGLANWTGLAATVIVVGLLSISSDFALRKLKARAWKNLQRLNYALFALVMVHAFFYGALLRVDSPYTVLLLLSVGAVVAGQTVGVWLYRQRQARAPTTEPA